MQANAHRVKLQMEFDLTKAQAVAKQYNLSPKTIEVWKHRGEIPAIYFRQSPFQESKLMDYLQNPKINAKAIFEKVGISYNKFIAANRTDEYHVHLSKEDVQILLDEIQQIKNSITLLGNGFWGDTTFSLEHKLLIEEYLSDNRLVILKVLECKPSDKLYCRYLNRKKPIPAKKFEDWECLVYLEKLKKLDLEL